MKYTIPVELQENSYPVYVGQGLLSELGSLLDKHKIGRKTMVITDENVAPLYASQVVESVKASQREVHLLVLPPGEPHKTHQSVQKAYDAMLENKLDRSSAVLALGGGIMGDLAGFVAATFMRGIQLVQIPTTLLAQVDAAIGGKTGYNHTQGKNLIGAFHQPKFVLSDPLTLQTLPQRELQAAMAEVVKYALIVDQGLLAICQGIQGQIQASQQALLTKIIMQCSQIKADVVTRDEREGGLRKILNYGHTVGHALEAVTQYKYFLHGESVFWGMLAATWLSVEKGLIPKESTHSILEWLKSLCQPALPELDKGALLERMRLDKKAKDNDIHFVLLNAIGSAVVQKVTDQDILASLEYIFA